MKPDTNVITFKKPTKVSEMVLEETSEKLVFIQEAMQVFQSIVDDIDGRLRISLPVFANQTPFIEFARKEVENLLQSTIREWDIEPPEHALTAWLDSWGGLCERFIGWSKDPTLEMGFGFTIVNSEDRFMQFILHKHEGKIILTDLYIDLTSMSSFLALLYMRVTGLTPRELFITGKQ